jgi:hypothetical protein
LPLVFWIVVRSVDNDGEGARTICFGGRWRGRRKTGKEGIGRKKEKGKMR